MKQITTLMGDLLVADKLNKENPSETDPTENDGTVTTQHLESAFTKLVRACNATVHYIDHLLDGLIDELSTLNQVDGLHLAATQVKSMFNELSKFEGYRDHLAAVAQTKGLKGKYSPTQIQEETGGLELTELQKQTVPHRKLDQYLRVIKATRFMIAGCKVFLEKLLSRLHNIPKDSELLSTARLLVGAKKVYLFFFVGFFS